MFPTPNTKMATDAVEYHVYLDDIQPDQEAPASTDQLATLTALRTRLMAAVSKHTSGYLWHRDSFNLQVWDLATEEASPEFAACPHLHGRTWLVQRPVGGVG